jgi:hypothetical protein
VRAGAIPFLERLSGSVKGEEAQWAAQPLCNLAQSIITDAGAIPLLERLSTHSGSREAAWAGYALRAFDYDDGDFACFNDPNGGW